MKVGAAISSRLDLEIGIRDTMKRGNHIIPGWRTRAYNPVFISLSPTPVSTYVLRKGRLINSECTNKQADTVSTPHPNQVDQAGSIILTGYRHIITREYINEAEPKHQTIGFNLGILFRATKSKMWTTTKPTAPIIM